MINKVCLVMQIGPMIRAVSGSSSLPGIETSLLMEISFITINVFEERENLCSVFRQLRESKELFLVCGWSVVFHLK